MIKREKRVAEERSATKIGGSTKQIGRPTAYGKHKVIKGFGGSGVQVT